MCLCQRLKEPAHISVCCCPLPVLIISSTSAIASNVSALGVSSGTVAPCRYETINTFYCKIVDNYQISFIVCNPVRSTRTTFICEYVMVADNAYITLPFLAGFIMFLFYAHVNEHAYRSKMDFPFTPTWKFHPYNLP